MTFSKINLVNILRKKTYWIIHLETSKQADKLMQKRRKADHICKTYTRLIFSILRVICCQENAIGIC